MTNKIVKFIGPYSPIRELMNLSPKRSIDDVLKDLHISEDDIKLIKQAHEEYVLDDKQKVKLRFLNQYLDLPRLYYSTEEYPALVLIKLGKDYYPYVKEKDHGVCLGWCIRNNKECGVEFFSKTVKLTPDYYYLAAKKGYVNIIKLLEKLNCPYNSNVVWFAAEGGNLECLEYVYTKTGHDYRAMNISAIKGHLDCIKFLHSKGCLWDHETCTMAVMRNNYDCLKYLLENGCVPSVTTMNVAAKHNRLTHMKLLHDYNCEWNHRTINTAIERRSVECLEYLIGNGCDMDDTVLICVQKYLPDLFNFVHIHAPLGARRAYEIMIG